MNDTIVYTVYMMFKENTVGIKNSKGLVDECEPERLFQKMAQIADYTNNELNKACLFEIE